MGIPAPLVSCPPPCPPREHLGIVQSLAIPFLLLPYRNTIRNSAMLQASFVSARTAIQHGSRATITTNIHLLPEILQHDLQHASSSFLLSSPQFSDIIDLIDWSKYWFMLPTCILIAFCANSSGIGGAALFGPIFLIVFPALGPQYPLSSPAAAVGVAILVESFGFSSGVSGYIRRGLIDFKTALKFAIIAMPTALIASKYLHLDALALKTTYSVLMLTLSAYLLQQSALSNNDNGSESTSDSSDSIGSGTATMPKLLSAGATTTTATTTTITESSGKSYRYPTPAVDLIGGAVTAAGGVLCGLLGVGIGELVLPQLLTKQVPVPVAAATSTLVVALTCVACAEVQISALIEAGGISAVPWSLVVYMIPGVIVGAQIAAALQGRFTKAQLEGAIGSLFGVIGVAFAVLTLQQSGLLAPR